MYTFKSPTPNPITNFTTHYRVFKDSIHMQLSEHGDGYFSNIIAPCTLDQVMDMVFVLSEIQRHPFIQVISLNNWVIPLRDLFLYRNCCSTGGESSSTTGSTGCVWHLSGQQKLHCDSFELVHPTAADITGVRLMYGNPFVVCRGRKRLLRCWQGMQCLCTNCDQCK